MAIDPNIKKKADDIRNKIYGKEVRESLASGLEEMSSDVVENEGRQSVVEGRQDSVESQWQAVSDEMTDKDVISAPEIIAARNGEANLKTRIDKDHQEVTTQLAQTTKHTSGWVNVKSFGAVGDGVTDDTQALKDANDYASEHNMKLLGADGEYLITSTFTITCDADLSTMKILADGRSVSPVVKVASGSGGKLGGRTITLPAIYNYYNGERTLKWENTGIGLEMVNLDQCVINTNYVNGFKNGIVCTGDDSGFAYNSINLMMVWGSQVALKLRTIGSGWCNENLFYNGRLITTDNSGSWDGTRNIQIESGNNNVFIKPSIESFSVEYGIELIEGSYNQFYGARYEGDGAKRVFFNTTSQNSTHSNMFVGGYQAINIKFSYGEFESRYNSLITGRDNKLKNLDVTYGDVTVRDGDPLNTTGWLSQMDVLGFHTKVKDDLYPRAELLSNGNLRLGRGNNDSYASLTYYNGLRMTAPAFHPSLDNETQLGLAGGRWSEIYAGTGTINTSDEREKDSIDKISDKILDAWSEVEWNTFKFKDAINKKGDDARWHFGLVAQRVKEVFENHGLNAFSYGVLCYDEWEDDDGNTHNRYGIRYDEAFALESALNRREIERLKALIK